MAGFFVFALAYRGEIKLGLDVDEKDGALTRPRHPAAALTRENEGACESCGEDL